MPTAEQGYENQVDLIALANDHALHILGDSPSQRLNLT
jgi:hypothetical protein